MRIATALTSLLLLTISATAHADETFVPVEKGAPVDVSIAGAPGMTLREIIGEKLIPTTMCTEKRVSVDETHDRVTRTCTTFLISVAVAEPVCDLPCKATVGTHRLHFVDGGASVPSPRFVVPSSPRPLVLRVRPVSTQSFGQGLGFSMVGGVGLAVGGLLVAGAAVGQGDPSGANGITATERRNFAIGGGITLAAGVAFLTAGIVTLVRNGSLTHVTTDGGVRLARAGFAWTPTGLAF